MTPRTWWVTGFTLAQLAALVATYPTDIGSRGWHHVASLAAVLGVAVLLAVVWPRLWRSRRFLGIGVLATTMLAVASGFYLLYWKEGIRVEGYQDWGVFWHVAWSWAAAVFFFQHTWVNRVAFVHFWRRSLHPAGAVVQVGLCVVAVGGLWATIQGRAWFTNENYIPISLWTWLAVTSVAYVLWWLVRGSPRTVRLAWRARTDLALVPLAGAATVSGVPLVWFDPWLGAAGLQYASKLWHVFPSIVFTVVVYAHSVQLWAPLVTHWKRSAGA